VGAQTSAITTDADEGRGEGAPRPSLKKPRQRHGPTAPEARPSTTRSALARPRAGADLGRTPPGAEAEPARPRAYQAPQPSIAAINDSVCTTSATAALVATSTYSTATIE
jgi:hypothetical protein